MSPIISYPGAIEKLFIYGTITKLCQHGDVTSNASIETLQYKLVANTVFVRFTSGDGLTSHLNLVVNDTTYTTAIAGVVKLTSLVKSILPVKPAVPTMTIRSVSAPDTSNTHDIYRTEYQIYQQQLDTYLLYLNTSKYIIKQIVAAYRYRTSKSWRTLS